MSRDRSNSPVFRSRSRSPREWKRPERRGVDRDRGNDRQSRDPHAKVRLYVSNLPYDVRWQDLKDLFREKVGSEISFIQLYDGPDGKPSGSGIVEVRSKEVAMKTIDVLHRYEIKGRSIIVREEREKDRLRHEPRHDNRAGDMSGGGGKPSLMGGANLLGATAMGGSGMMALLNAQGLMGGALGGGGGNSLAPILGQLGIEMSCITNQVFVTNLDYKVSVAKLEEIFKIAGNVIEAEIKTDKDGKSRGMGIVRFEHPMEAVQAIALFNGQGLYERQMGVRMDKMVDPIMQDIPRRLPTGLKAIGVGLGSNGQPLLNIGEISNTLTLCILTGQFSSANLGMFGNNANALSSMGAAGANLLNLGGGMTGMTGVGGSMAGMMGGMGGVGGGLGSLGGGNSSAVGGGGGGGFGLMGGAGMGSSLGGGGGGTSGLGSSMASPLGGFSSSLGGLRGSGLGDGGLMSKGSGGGLGGLGSGLGGSLGAMSDSRMGSLAGDLYGSLGSSLGYDRGGNLDRIGSSYDHGLDRSDSYKSSENSTIFVKNLPYSFTWQNLVDRFRDCGEIKFAEIKMDNGRSRGCGIVQFLNSESARRAINLMNGARIEGRQIEVRLDRLL